MSIEKLERQALDLPLDLRARLARVLLESLEEERDMEREWVAEAERRLEGVLSGGISVRSAEDAIREADSAASSVTRRSLSLEPHPDYLNVDPESLVHLDWSQAEGPD